MLQTEIDKQHVLQGFVDREVIYCVSSLVSKLAVEPLFAYEEFPELFEGPPSLYRTETECPQCDTHYEDESEDWGKKVECPKCHLRMMTMKDAWEPAEYQEIFEHWIVSTWLANRLEEHGEAVCKDFYGLTVWGRTISGQGIAGDSVIEDIYDDLHKEG